MSNENFESVGGVTNNQETRLRSVDEVAKELAAARQEKGKLMQASQVGGSPELGGEGDRINDDLRKITIVEGMLEDELSKAKARQQTLTEKFEGKAANDESNQRPITEGTNDDYLHRRMEGDERKAA